VTRTFCFANPKIAGKMFAFPGVGLFFHYVVGQEEPQPRRRNLMKTVSKILGSLAFAAFYMSCASGHEFNPGGIIYGVVLVILSGLCAAMADSNTKVVKDADAKERVEKVMKGEDAYFYLYLRPFSITRRIPMKNPRLGQVQDSFRPDRVQDFERVLATALEKSGTPLIALGKPGEAVGAGRYQTSDENWQSVFDRLASVATAILMVPSTHTGTLVEIEWLVEHGMIGKTVFFQPPRKDAENWDSIVEAYAQHGLHLPKELTTSLIFKLGSDGQVVRTFPLSVLWSAQGGVVVQGLARLNGESAKPEQANQETAPPLQRQA
jgi:hypothetical protein